jgi:hypothetical protein
VSKHKKKKPATTAAHPPSARPPAGAPSSDAAPSARRSSARLRIVGLGIVVLAIATTVVVLVRSGGGTTARPAADMSFTESYPVMSIYLTTRTGSKDPARPPRTVAETEAVARRLVEQLRKPGADFGALAFAESDDPVSAADGGFGGFLSRWPYHGKYHMTSMVDAVARLAVGEISDPVPLPGGFMIFQRMSRDDGRRVEAKVTAAVRGFAVAWHDLDPSVVASQTKAIAYTAAASAASDLRSGATATVEDAMSRLEGASPLWMVLRRGTDPVFVKLAEAALAAEPDHWLDPFEIKNGWAVVRRRAYVRCSVRHILVTHVKSAKPVPTTARTIEEAERIAQAALDRVRKDPSSWDRVVAEVSDEKATKDLGGYLGELCTVGDPDHTLEPEIEEAVLALKPGDFSDVKPSRYGLHVFWRVD